MLVGTVDNGGRQLVERRRKRKRGNDSDESALQRRWIVGIIRSVDWLVRVDSKPFSS